MQLHILKNLFWETRKSHIGTRSVSNPLKKHFWVLVSLIEPTSVDEALLDKDWILAMEEELNQFLKNDV